MKPAYWDIEFSTGGFPLKVIAEVEPEKGVELAGGTPCIWALDRKEPSFQAEWILPRGTVQKISGAEMPQRTVTAAEVAKAGGGVVYAPVKDQKWTIVVVGFGLLERDGKAEGAVKIHARFVRMRIVGVKDKRPGSVGILPTIKG